MRRMLFHLKHVMSVRSMATRKRDGNGAAAMEQRNTAYRYTLTQHTITTYKYTPFKYTAHTNTTYRYATHLDNIGTQCKHIGQGFTVMI